MADRGTTHEIEGLSNGALCLALFAKYVGLTLYGAWAAVVEIPTFVIVGSSTFAAAWAMTVALLAGLAAAGVARTWITGRYRLEKWSTAAFILVFTIYSWALIIRAVDTGDADALPLALVPLIVCILPTIQYYRLVLRQFLGRRRVRG